MVVLQDPAGEAFQLKGVGLLGARVPYTVLFLGKLAQALRLADAPPAIKHDELRFGGLVAAFEKEEVVFAPEESHGSLRR